MGSSEFIGVVEEHVEQVVERCSYGERPLLADGLDLETGKPLVWKGNMLSNLPASRFFCEH